MSAETSLIAFVERALAQAERPRVIGLCGAQGSGKSTLAARIAGKVPGTAILSLDDLYLTRAARQELGRTVHPLLATRGVPGTHDVALGIATLDRLRAGERVRLPRFSKAADDRLPEREWPVVEAPRLILFEGWCVGARPLPRRELDEPLNRLERDEDAEGIWRHWWNAALAEDYQALFARIDRLALLAAPDWATVLDWRLQQEHALRGGGASGPGVMSDEAVARFISHYERLTRHILHEMPARADLTLWLDANRAIKRPV